MTNLVVISFRNREKALEGSEKLFELESQGDFTIYEKIIVVKEPDGDTSIIESNTSEGIRFFSGLALGSMIGAFAGPVGLAIGMISGTITGAVLETHYDAFTEDFNAKTFESLKPGEAAIIAEIYEEDPNFLDVACEQMGATLSRSNVDYVQDKFVDDQVEQIDEEISAERAKLKSDAKADRAAIGEKISRLKIKRRQRIIDLKAKQKGAVIQIKASMEGRKKSRIINKINHYQERIGELEEKLKAMDH